MMSGTEYRQVMENKKKEEEKTGGFKKRPAGMEVAGEGSFSEIEQERIKDKFGEIKASAFQNPNDE